MIGMRGRSGELVVEAGNNIGTVMFHQGMILHASSPYSRAIGDLMVEQGLITENELIETLKAQKKEPSAPLGGLLLKQGRVTYEIIEMMVYDQIRSSIREFQSWGDISSSFSDKAVKPYDQLRLPVKEFIIPETYEAAKAFIASVTPQ